jgi:F-type H+-transporting ATPase subunit epsilon
VTLQVKLVVPEGEVWTGQADRVIAKTLEGDVGILTGHTPVLGILAAGSVIRILPEDSAADGWIQAAIGSGFLSVADNRVSILARQATLGDNVDKVAVRAELDETLGAAQASQGSEPAEAGYLRAQLRAAGDEA